jgi:protease I
MKKILMILASENFRDIEYIVPRAFFEQAGHKVFTASSAPESKGRFGFVVKNDFAIDQVNPGDFDGIFYVGGNGSLEYIENDTTAFMVITKPFICAAAKLLW